MEASMWVEIGLGLNGEFRDYLGRLKLTDPTLRWHEGRGFITRRYDIVGKRETIQRIQRDFARYEAITSPPASKQSKG